MASKTIRSAPQIADKKILAVLRSTLRVLRSDCRGIHDTDQRTGATYAEMIDAALAYRPVVRS